MYRIDNVSSEKILIQFINLFTDWGTWLQILHFAESWLGWSFGMVRWPLHHNIISQTLVWFPDQAAVKETNIAM